METQNIEPLDEMKGHSIPSSLLTRGQFVPLSGEEKTEVEEVEDIQEIQAPKKPRTEKQIEAFKKVIEKRNENRKIRAEEKEKVAEQEKIVLEEKIIKKAVSIKKKQIKKQIVLDDITDDDEPIEDIKHKIIKSKKIVPVPAPIPPPQPQKPKIYFV